MNSHGLTPLPREIEVFDPTQPSFWQRLQHPLRLLLAASGIALGVFAFHHYEVAHHIDTASLTQLIAPLGPWAPLAFIGVFIIAMLLMVIPFGAVSGLAALLFGPAWGTLWSVLGGTLAALAVLGLSRRVGHKILARRAGQAKWERLNARLQAEGFYYLLLIRAISVVPFNLVNFACAFTAIRLRDFMLATLIGLIPASLLCNYGVTLLLDPTTPPIFLMAIAGGLMFFTLGPLVLRQARRRRQHRRRAQIHTAFAHFDPHQRRVRPGPPRQPRPPQNPPRASHSEGSHP